YGRNSSAGAVNIITKVPTREFSGSVQLGFGNWDERRLKGYVSVPLDDNGDWAFSVNGMVRERDGGRQVNPTLGEKVGESEFQGGIADLVYRGDRLDARASVFLMNTDGDGQFAINTIVDNGEIVPISGSYRTTLSPVRSTTE